MKLLQELDALQSARMELQHMGKECSSFLQHGTQWYRGVRNPLGIRRVEIRQDRKPLDSSAIESALFNYLFERVHGIADIRMKTAFCTSSRTQALSYGRLCWIFPTNNSVIWANAQIRDSLKIMDKLSEYARELSVDALNFISEHNTHSGSVFTALYNSDIKYIEHIRREIDEIAQQTQAMFTGYKQYSPADVASIPTNVELMLYGAPYYVVPTGWVQDTFNTPNNEDLAFEYILKQTNP